MQRIRLLPLLLALIAVMVSPAAAQRAEPPACSDGEGDYRACAMHAAKVRDLRDERFFENEREVRFWTTSGLFFPEDLLVIHQRGDSVTGKLLLIWPDSSMSDQFILERCAEGPWTTVSGSLCVARLDRRPDWAHLLRTLDAQGLARLPSDPVRRERCAMLPSGAKPGDRPRLPPCRFIDDGFSHAVEVRISGVYWRYDFERVPDPSSKGLKRDAAILRMLKCAVAPPGAAACSASAP